MVVSGPAIDDLNLIALNSLNVKEESAAGLELGDTFGKVKIF